MPVPNKKEKRDMLAQYFTAKKTLKSGSVSQTK